MKPIISHWRMFVYAFIVVFFIQAALLGSLSSIYTCIFSFFSGIFLLADGFSEKSDIKSSASMIGRSVIAYPMISFGIAYAHYIFIKEGTIDIFNVPEPDFNLILLFYIDNFLKGAFIDVMEIYEINLTVLSVSGNEYLYRFCLLLLRSLPGITIIIAIGQIISIIRGRLFDAK